MTTKHYKYRRDELENYCKDKYGYVKCVKQSMHIGLPPWGLTKIKETVRDTVLEEKFGHFDAKLGGIVLDIRNITILGDNYPVHNDSSAVHVSLNVNFYVFQPREGVIVKGIIKHIAFHHISVTIHRFFNVTIPMEKKNNNLKIDMEVNVRLTKLDFEDSIPYFEGETELPIGHEKKENSTDSGICTTNGTKVKLKKTTNEEISSDSDDDSLSDSASSSDDVDFTKIKVKKEPVSSSKSSSSDSDSDDESTNTGCGGKLPLMKVAIKREISSSTSSSSDAEDIIQNAKRVKSKKKVKRETPSNKTTSTQSQMLQNIQDQAISSVEQVEKEKSSVDRSIDDFEFSPVVSSTSKKRKKKEEPSVSSNEVGSIRPQEIENIQDKPVLIAKKVKKEKSPSATTSNDETNFSPGFSSTSLKKKHKKKSSREPSLSSNDINSTWCQKVNNIQDEPNLFVKKEKSLSPSSSDEITNFLPYISSNHKKKSSKK